MKKLLIGVILATGSVILIKKIKRNNLSRYFKVHFDNRKELDLLTNDILAASEILDSSLKELNKFKPTFSFE